MSQFISQLKAELTQDIKDLNQLTLLLDQEKALLKTRKSKEIEALTAQKSRLLKQIESRAKVKAQLFMRSGLGIKPGKVEQALQTLNDHELLDLWTKSRDQLTHCKEQNLVNGAIIARTKQRVSRLMDIIRGKNSAQSLYGQQGKQQSYTANQSIAKA